MKVPILNRAHPLLQLVIIALTTLISFFIFAALGLVIVIAFYPVNLAELIEITTSTGIDHIGILKILQISQSIGIFIVPAFLLGWLASHNPAGYLGFKRTLSTNGFLFMILILLAAQPVVIYSGVLNQYMTLPEFLSGLENWMQDMESRAMDLTESFLTVSTLGGLMVNIVMIAIIPGVGEELFFRGLLQQSFVKLFKNVHVAVFVTAILFSALHMQFYGFFPRFLLGLLFGYLFVWSGNIWYPILAHTIHNAIPVIVYFLYEKELTTNSFDEVGEGSFSWAWALAGIIAMLIFIRQFRQSVLSHSPK